MGHDPKTLLQSGQWGSEDYRLPFFSTTLSTNYQLFDTLSTYFIDFSTFRIFGPGKRLSTQVSLFLNVAGRSAS